MDGGKGSNGLNYSKNGLENSDKARSYHEKLSQLKWELDALQSGNHWKLAEIEQDHLKRIKLNQSCFELGLQRLERDHSAEEEAILEEYERAKMNLQNGLVVELEERKRQLEKNRFSMKYLLTMTDESAAGASAKTKKIATEKASSNCSFATPRPKKRPTKKKQHGERLPDCMTRLKRGEIEADLQQFVEHTRLHEEYTAAGTSNWPPGVSN